MLHLPVLRFGAPYRSLETVVLTDIRDGEPVVEVSQANPGLVARDLGRVGESRRELAEIAVAELIAICKRAAEHFAHGELPVGDATQSADDFVRLQAATTGLPEVMARRNMSKIHFVLDEMERILAGLTRGLDPEVLDTGWGTRDGRMLSFRRETDVLGAILPSNSPGVHSLWLPSVPLKTPLALKPGRQEPWTPYRVCQAFFAAGLPPTALGFYPTSYAGANEILMRCGRSLLFGDRDTVAPWHGDARIQLHGPGWSKVLLGPDRADSWSTHLDLIEASVADNGGRSCINASGVWTTGRGRELAEGLAARFAAIEARPLDHPEARLAAFPSLEGARALSDYIDAQLAQPGAEDLTAPLRPDGRVAEIGGCAFLLPTVVYCTDPDHPLAKAEFLFPFVSVVEVGAGEIVSRMGETLVLSALTAEPELVGDLLNAANVERLNLGDIPTSHVSWDQPHEGNLFEHLYRQRAFQTGHDVAGSAVEMPGERSP